MGFRADARAAAVALLDGYKAAHPTALKQIYGARPLSIFAPSAFVDSITEDINYTAHLHFRNQSVSIRFVHGNFDGEDSAAQSDALIDGFIQYAIDNRHQAGPNTLAAVTNVENDPGWVPEWIPDPVRAYFTTLVTLTEEASYGD